MPDASLSGALITENDSLEEIDMNNCKAHITENRDIRELDSHEVVQVAGGKTVYVDGVQMEVSDMALSALLNVAAQITVKGVAYPGSQDEDW